MLLWCSRGVELTEAAAAADAKVTLNARHALTTRLEALQLGLYEYSVQMATTQGYNTTTTAAKKRGAIKAGASARERVKDGTPLPPDNSKYRNHNSTTIPIPSPRFVPQSTTTSAMATRQNSDEFSAIGQHVDSLSASVNPSAMNSAFNTAHNSAANLNTLGQDQVLMNLPINQDLNNASFNDSILTGSILLPGEVIDGEGDGDGDGDGGRRNDRSSTAPSGAMRHQHQGVSDRAARSAAGGKRLGVSDHPMPMSGLTLIHATTATTLQNENENENPLLQVRGRKEGLEV